MPNLIPPHVAVRSTVTELQKLAERVEAQLDFAGQILELDGAAAQALHGPLLARARGLAATVFAADGLPAVRRGVAEVEEMLAPIGTLAKAHTIYCVGHGHIDMNWMWSWPETVAITNDTFSTVLKLMEEFPHFCFSQSQASVYAMIEQHNPALFARIAGAIKKGRWEVTASHWVEGDRNMVSGESLTRHLLYTRAYLKDRFGLRPQDVTIDWSPDTFGHPLSVPMYLVRGGVKYIYLHRPGHWATPRPQAFWWRSPDGSRVLVRNDMDNGYNGAINPAITRPLLQFRRANGLKFVMFVYGVGDHGGGPTRMDLARLVEMNAWPIFPALRFARAVEFYDRLAEEGSALPTLECELNPEVVGCYTTQSLIKRSNRIAENRLLDAEAISTIAATAAGQVYPRAQLKEAWHDTLFCHFHDILPGSNVHDSRTWMHGLFQKTMATTSMAETQALRAIAAQVKTAVEGLSSTMPPAGASRASTAGVGIGAGRWMLDQAEQSDGATVRPLVVFNPTAWERSEVVEATLWTDPPAWRGPDAAKPRFQVRLSDGTIVPAQKIESGNTWGHAFTRIAFPVRVPALGYATYHVIEDDATAAGQTAAAAQSAAAPSTPDAHQVGPTHHCHYLRHERTIEGLENEFVRLELDVNGGGIHRLIDKRSGLELIAPDASGPRSLLEYAVERPHPMSAWIIENHGAVEQPRVLAIEKKLAGPYKASIDVKLSIHESEFTLTYELRAGDPQLYLHLIGTWFQRGTPQTGVPTLRLALPLQLTALTGRYEIPFGSIERTLAGDQEVPALNWAAVSGQTPSGTAAGLLLCNDCKHGHALAGSTLRLTLIRAAYDPDPLPEIGKHEVHLSLLPFVGECPVIEAIQLGRNLNHPLRVCGTTVHEGPLPATAAGLSVAGDGVLLCDLKAAEGDGVIIRVLNVSAEAQTARIETKAALLGSFRSAVEVDLMEQPISPSTSQITGGTLTVRVPAVALASVHLER